MHEEPETDEECDTRALTDKHYLTHFPKHPQCKICQQAKLKRRRAQRVRAVDRAIFKKFGDSIGADHLISLGVVGYDSETAALLIRDAWSKFVSSQPQKQKTAESIMHHLADFADDCKRIGLRADNSRELILAANLLKQHLGVSHQKSVPYRSQSNSSIERWVQEVVRGVRCILLQSGLPEKFWSLALTAWTNAYNITPNRSLPDGVSPMHLRHPDHDPRHEAIAPYGSLRVYCKCKRLGGAESFKFESGGHKGVVVGSYVHANGLFDGSWLVLNLNALVEYLCADGSKPAVLRTTDSQPVSPLEFPVADLRVQAKAIKMTRAAELPELMLRAIRLE